MSPLNLSPRRDRSSQVSEIGKRTMKVRLPKITSCQNVPQGVYFLSFSRLAMEGKYAALAEEDAEIAFGFGSVNQSAEQAAFPSLPQPMRQRHIRRTRDGWKIQGGSYTTAGF